MLPHGLTEEADALDFTSPPHFGVAWNSPEGAMWSGEAYAALRQLWINRKSHHRWDVQELDSRTYVRLYAHHPHYSAQIFHTPVEIPETKTSLTSISVEDLGFQSGVPKSYRIYTGQKVQIDENTVVEDFPHINAFYSNGAGDEYYNTTAWSPQDTNQRQAVDALEEPALQGIKWRDRVTSIAKVPPTMYTGLMRQALAVTAGAGYQDRYPQWLHPSNERGPRRLPDEDEVVFPGEFDRPVHKQECNHYVSDGLVRVTRHGEVPQDIAGYIPDKPVYQVRISNEGITLAPAVFQPGSDPLERQTVDIDASTEVVGPISSYEVSRTETSATYATGLYHIRRHEQAGDATYLEYIKRFGGIMNGDAIGISTRKKNIRAGLYVELASTGDMDSFYSGTFPIYLLHGWAFNYRGDKADNTAHSFGDTGMITALHWRVSFAGLIELPAPVIERPLAIAGLSALTAYMERWIGTHQDLDRETVEYKLSRLTESEIISLVGDGLYIEAEDPSLAQEFNDFQVSTPCVAGTAVLGMVDGGYLANPGKSPATQCKWPDYLLAPPTDLPNVTSMNFSKESGYQETRNVFCDTVVDAWYGIGGGLHTLRFYNSGKTGTSTRINNNPPACAAESWTYESERNFSGGYRGWYTTQMNHMDPQDTEYYQRIDYSTRKVTDFVITRHCIPEYWCCNTFRRHLFTTRRDILTQSSGRRTTTAASMVIYDRERFYIAVADGAEFEVRSTSHDFITIDGNATATGARCLYFWTVGCGYIRECIDCSECIKAKRWGKCIVSVTSEFETACDLPGVKHEKCDEMDDSNNFPNLPPALPPNVTTTPTDNCNLHVYVESSALGEAIETLSREGVDYYKSFGSSWFTPSPDEFGFYQWLYSRSVDTYGRGDFACQKTMNTGDTKALGAAEFKALLEQSGILYNYIGMGV